MIAKIKLIRNLDDIQRAEFLGLTNTPEEEVIYNKVLFSIDLIEMAYINADNNIILRIHEDYIEIKYDDNVWNKLMGKFK